MYIKLSEPRSYRGKPYPAGAILSVGGDLGRRLVTASAATESTEEAYDAYTAEQTKPKKKTLSAMNKTEMLEAAATAGVEANESMTKAEIISAIETQDN